MISGNHLGVGWLISLALSGCLSVNLTAQSKDEPQSAPALGSITGQVVSESGHAIQNANVVIRASIPMFQPRVASTDNEGKFQISGLSPSLYAVSVFASSYVYPLRDPDAPADYYRPGDSVSITLIKGGVITGTVTTSSGDPLVQMTVQAIMLRDANGHGPRGTGYQQMKLTDDRGIYRIYGLRPGTYVVAAGGRSFSGPFAGAYDTNALTYAPASTRDTAAEFEARSGEETSGVDIRHREDPGHVISGQVIGPFDPNTPTGVSVTLTQVIEGNPVSSAYSFQPPGSKGFAFYGVSDGDYELNSQTSGGPGETSVDSRRITVKGSDVTGVELTLKPLGAIAGRVVFEKLTATECQNKRQPAFAETLVLARRNEKSVPKDQPRMQFFSSQGTPNKSGDFQLRNLNQGQYNINTRFFAKYWFLKSISREVTQTQLATQRSGSAPRQSDLARLDVSLKPGERVTGVTVTLSEGAASLAGAIKLEPGQSVAPKLYLHLVPAEKEDAENALRFFAAGIRSDATFSLTNLPPGRYWVLARIAAESESLLESRVRLSEESELRLKLRRLAEAGKTAVEFKPCQNTADYSLSFATETPHQ